MKTVKVSKDSIWFVVRHFIGLFAFFIIYSTISPVKGKVIIPLFIELNIFEFFGWVGLLMMSLYLIYLVFFEMIPAFVLLLWGKVNPKDVEGLKQFTVEIPIYEKDIEAFDKKFKRKRIPFDGRDTEFDSDFSKRIINEMIKREMKRK